MGIYSYTDRLFIETGSASQRRCVTIKIRRLMATLIFRIRIYRKEDTKSEWIYCILLFIALARIRRKLRSHGQCLLIFISVVCFGNSIEIEKKITLFSTVIQTEKIAHRMDGGVKSANIHFV